MKFCNQPARRLAKRSANKQSAEPDWVALRDEELLDVRMCDLGLKIEGTVLESRIERIYGELEHRGIRLRPHCWLAEEWFSPDGVPGIAIPFYLAHPRLMRLEDRQMLEVEGGTANGCMRILRHETGHAFDTAYRLHRRARWRRVFGKTTQPYPQFYRPKPYSKNFVLHLDSWYAQSHPAEDFAETFAVWLKPDSRWRSRYTNWPALKKLEYVDELVGELAGQAPLVRSRQQIEPISRMRTTLRQHYDMKRARYEIGHPEFYDRDLRRLFSDAPQYAQCESATVFLRRTGPSVRKLVADWTGQHQYVIDQVLQEMVTRCRHLKLRRHRAERQTKQEATLLLTVQTMNYLHGGRHRLAL